MKWTYLQKMGCIILFSILWVTFALLDPDPIWIRNTAWYTIHGNQILK